MQKSGLVLFFLWVLALLPLHAQVYPVQVTPQLVPPYSVYLADYAQPEVDKLRLILLLKDLTQASYQVRLSLSLERNGKVILATRAGFNPPPLDLLPGIPTLISGADLAPYLESRNLDFVGYSREEYERTRALPEGAYKLCVTAYDYRIRSRPVQVSNTGCAFYYLAKSEPPLLNTPVCGTKIPVRDIPQIVFSWLPRNTASPNSSQETEYEFSLYESRPANRNPNDVVLSTRPVFETRTEQPQLVYGLAEPMLLEGITYVWRVRAIDKSGKDAFRNQGYSEVCTFVYDKAVPDIIVGKVNNFSAEATGERKAKMNWSADSSATQTVATQRAGQGFDAYTIEYRKTSLKPDGSKWAWFSINKAGTETEALVLDLEPATEYETRMSGSREGVNGAYSELVTFTTPAPKPVVCGEAAQEFVQADASKPLDVLLPGMVLQARGLELSVTEVGVN
ncbi:MAG: fibronectin type III domain-containing protein, partial [Verrucomicrobia bacterium]|nr:fibronectin type III domain-containing protein [Cytophagales bacterium]